MRDRKALRVQAKGRRDYLTRFNRNVFAIAVRDNYVVDYISSSIAINASHLLHILLTELCKQVAVKLMPIFPRRSFRP